MHTKWKDASLFRWKNAAALIGPISIRSLPELKDYLDRVHIIFCLLKPYFETRDYPLVEARSLLPSFENDLYEYKDLPGFSMVALDRPLDYFHESFQFDILHSTNLDDGSRRQGAACPLEGTILDQNLETMRMRLPRYSRDAFLGDFAGKDICYLENYPQLMSYLLMMERAHVMAKDSTGEFHLAGVFGSLPSDLDSELKRFGIRIGKFAPGDNARYERNRLFVYQFLMELYGYPIASERRTSAALFSRRLFRMNEEFLVRVMGQSDRTITTLYTHPEARQYPRVEKLALIQVNPNQKDAIEALDDGGFFVDREKRVVILRVLYRQHGFNPGNVREDRALSVLSQEVIHPLENRVMENVNLIQHTGNMILRLNDIVRGEYQGQVTYKRYEMVLNTDTHEKRLKFLYSWLSKHQRRIIGYSDEFYAGVVKVLDGYLLAPDNNDAFKDMRGLFQEVWTKYSYIQQARKVQALQELAERKGREQRLSYREMLDRMLELFSDLKFEMVTYFDTIVSTALHIGDKVLSAPYLRNNFVNRPEESLTAYGREVKKLYGRIVSVMDELAAIRKARGEDVQSQAV